MCDFFFVSSCTEECLRVLMHFCHFLNDVMFSYSFASFLLCSSTGSAAPLCFPLHQPHSLLCFLSLLSLYLCLSSLVGFQAGQQSIWEFQLLLFFFCSFLLSFSVFDCFTVTVYVDSLFSLDSVFSWNSKLDDKSADTFFLADTESQGLPLSHSP